MAALLKNMTCELHYLYNAAYIYLTEFYRRNSFDICWKKNKAANVGIVEINNLVWRAQYPTCNKPWSMGKRVALALVMSGNASGKSKSYQMKCALFILNRAYSCTSNSE